MRAALSDPAHALAPGCVASTFAQGQPVGLVAQGYADLADQRPLDGDSLFYAASVSKQFTALAAATLIAQGKLALDDDVRQYLPELPVYDAPITVGMLMHHTSGIRDSLGLLRMAGVSDVGTASKDDALDLLFRQQHTQFTPGTRYSYSNGGYLLLAEIVERVVGEAFADYARRAIFAPLGMERSFFLNDNSPAAGTFAHGYVPEGDGFALRDSFPRFSGSGGLMLSMNDLARYEYDIEQGHRVWTPEVTQIMLAPGRYTDGSLIDDGGGLAYGGGLHLGEKGGQAVVVHTGSAEAFKHAYLRLPDQHSAFAVLCNRGDWKATDRLKAVMAASDVRYPGMPLSSPEGLFHSSELNAYFRLTPSDDGIAVEVTSPFIAAPVVQHYEADDDGGFHHETMSITPTDNPDRLRLKRGTTAELTLTRVNQEAAQ
ncbi:class A beta-lactamase-related serine hydrolase [Aurantiacibacter xanthus]|uniref:Class A beta-lactamase-related serine hydrolase n=2 Tax=Aurantiacibacter xanthus TaxID=1784712 RepID=A0A3A1P4D9_9SPHN|nr:class A beta-lactamase-related serine hydrolase [Aurantiacibacter xanthus]